MGSTRLPPAKPQSQRCLQARGRSRGKHGRACPIPWSFPSSLQPAQFSTPSSQPSSGATRPHRQRRRGAVGAARDVQSCRKALLTSPAAALRAPAAGASPWPLGGSWCSTTMCKVFDRGWASVKSAQRAGAGGVSPAQLRAEADSPACSSECWHIFRKAENPQKSGYF